jgi:hypothetical protein
MEGPPESSTVSSSVDHETAKPPVNKVHEWAAAVVIMVLLAAILVAFLLFLRQTSL